MSNEKRISPIPDIPKEIEEAINRKNLAIFIGAGVSRLMGCKDWNTLAKELLKVCYEKEYISYVEYKTLEDVSDNKKLISIAYGILKEKDEDEYYKKLNEALTPNLDKIKKNNIYKKIYHMGTTFVTTNADTCFDSFFGDNTSNITWTFNDNDIFPENHHLYHIHGSMLDRESLIFTTSQYLRHYQNPKYKMFLKSLFEKYVVLFIGYGLAEFELLDFLMLKTEGNEKKESPKHFALMPYYSYQKKVSEYYELYFNDLNIQTIPFAKDHKEYEQLLYVVDSWKKKIEDTTFSITNAVEDLTAIIQKNSLTKTDIDKIIQLIGNSEIVLTEFINLCRKHKSTTYFLIKPLYEKRWFSPEKNKRLIESVENPEYFRILSWSIIDFLEIYVLYVNETGKKEYYTIFKEIIFENIKDIGSERIENSRMGKSLVEFIFTLEETDITEKCIDFLSYALHAKWDRMLISDVVLKKVLPRVINFADMDKVCKIISIIFSFDDKELDRNIFYIDHYHLGIIIKEYFDKIYTKLGGEFINIIEDIMSKLKPESLIMIRYNFHNKPYPSVSGNSCEQVLVDCYIWLVLQQQNSINFLNQRKKEKDGKLKGLLEKMIYYLDNPSLQRCGDYYDLEVDLGNKEFKLDDKPLDCIQNVISFINNNSTIENENENTPSFFYQSRKIYNVILEDPVLLLSNLVFFEEKHFVYIHQILSAYVSLMRESKIENVKPLISFIEKILCRTELWEGKKKERVFDYEQMTINDISDFVLQYCLNYSQGISFEEYRILRSFILKIYENLSEEEIQISDYVVYMLNSESGKCVEALINLYFCSFLLSDKKGDDDIRKIFKKEIKEKKLKSIFTAFASYYPGFYYYDKNFALSIYSDTLGVKDEELKNAVMDGCLYIQYVMTREYYEFLKEKKFFDEKINDVSDNEEWCSYIARIACSAYIEGIENLDNSDSLLSKIIENAFVMYIDSVNSYFYNLREEISSDDKLSKIIKLWSKIREKLETYKEDTTYDKCIVDMLKYIDLISHIDEEVMENIKFSISRLPIHSIGPDILDSLLRMYTYEDEENCKHIEKILELLSEKKVYLYDYNGRMTQLFRNIYNCNPSEAKKLCNIYVQAGYNKYLELLQEFKLIEGFDSNNE